MVYGTIRTKRATHCNMCRGNRPTGDLTEGDIIQDHQTSHQRKQRKPQARHQVRGTRPSLPGPTPRTNREPQEHLDAIVRREECAGCSIFSWTSQLPPEEDLHLDVPETNLVNARGGTASATTEVCAPGRCVPSRCGKFSRRYVSRAAPGAKRCGECSTDDSHEGACCWLARRSGSTGKHSSAHL